MPVRAPIVEREDASQNRETEENEWKPNFLESCGKSGALKGKHIKCAQSGGEIHGKYAN